jgi:uncharacterized protein YndB with AHSA1/START domain
MSGRFERFDARPGGSYRLVLTYDDDSAGSGKATPSSDVVEARFVDVVPGVRVVQAVDFARSGWRPRWPTSLPSSRGTTSDRSSRRDSPDRHGRNSLH